jgi:hypothetical protein
MKAPMDKRTALSAANGLNLENRLFFQARNLAIEALLLRLETTLLRQGFDAHCEWSESSFGGPLLYIRMHNPKKDGGWQYGQCTATLARETICCPSTLSPCYYSLKSFSAEEYWGRKQPKLLLDFRHAVDELHKSGYLAAEIDKVNFPFDYKGRSVF